MLNLTSYRIDIKPFILKTPSILFCELVIILDPLSWSVLSLLKDSRYIQNFLFRAHFVYHYYTIPIFVEVKCYYSVFNCRNQIVARYTALNL